MFNCAEINVKNRRKDDVFEKKGLLFPYTYSIITVSVPHNKKDVS